MQYVFNCVEFKLHTMLTAPLHMFVDPNQSDFLLGNKFMQYSGFFFDIITKSMAQYLINTGRIKVSTYVYNYKEKLGLCMGFKMATLVSKMLMYGLDS